MSYCVIICVPTKKIYPRLGGSLPKKSARLMVVLTALLLMLGRGGGLKGDRPNRLATPNIARGMVGRGRALLLSLSWKHQQKGINKSRKKEVMLVITWGRPSVLAIIKQRLTIATVTFMLCSQQSRLEWFRYILVSSIWNDFKWFQTCSSSSSNLFIPV